VIPALASPSRILRRIPGATSMRTDYVIAGVVGAVILILVVVLALFTNVFSWVPAY
jgi:hypothetical protein